MLVLRLTGGKNLKRLFSATMTIAILFATVFLAGCIKSPMQNNTTIGNGSKTAPASVSSTAPIGAPTVPFSANQLRSELNLTAPGTAKAGEQIPVSGTLICYPCKNVGISGALIHDQQWNPDTNKWITVGNAYTTDEKGIFHHNFSAHDAGTYYFRVTFDGDSQYTRAASNVVTVTVN